MDNARAEPGAAGRHAQVEEREAQALRTLWAAATPLGKELMRAAALVAAGDDEGMRDLSDELTGPDRWAGLNEAQRAWIDATTAALADECRRLQGPRGVSRWLVTLAECRKVGDLHVLVEAESSDDAAAQAYAFDCVAEVFEPDSTEDIGRVVEVQPWAAALSPWVMEELRKSELERDDLLRVALVGDAPAEGVRDG